MAKLDFLKAFGFTQKSQTPHHDAIMGQKISNMLTQDPHVVYLETPLTRVVQYMIETGYKSFPLTNDDRVVGIVAREDIIRALWQAAQGEGTARGGSVWPNNNL